MARRERLIVISEEGLPWAFLTFFILEGDEEIARFHERPMWTTPPDAEQGRVIYLDVLAGLAWNRNLLRQTERLLVARVPSVQRFVWYRPSRRGDKRYTYIRREP